VTGSARTRREGDRPSLQALDRTFAILDLFGAERPEWTATEVARALDLPVPTAHRILSALAGHGYVGQDPGTKRYRLGVAAVRLGERAREVVDLRSVALPALRRLSRDTGETALLTGLTPRHDRGVCLERVETDQPLRLSVTPGRRLPLHAGASQKALLAYLEPQIVDRLLGGPLERLCHDTITDPAKLRGELALIRERGWADSYEETNVGVWGIAVPILDDRGAVVCAVGIAGPSARLAEDRIDELLTRTHTAATEIASATGSHVPWLSRTTALASIRSMAAAVSTTGRR